MFKVKSNFQLLSLSSTRGASRPGNSSMACNVQEIVSQPLVSLKKIVMRNNPTNSAIAATGSHRLTTNARNASTPKVYEIESAEVNGYIVLVDLLINSGWSYACISLLDLESFVKATGMNEFVIDSCACGEHVQDAGSFDAETFVIENLNEVLIAYFKAGKDLPS